MASVKQTEQRLTEMEDRFMNMNEQELRDYAAMWYPGGSGPIGAMYAVTSLVRTIAKLRGIDISEIK